MVSIFSVSPGVERVRGQELPGLHQGWIQRVEGVGGSRNCARSLVKPLQKTSGCVQRQAGVHTAIFQQGLFLGVVYKP